MFNAPIKLNEAQIATVLNEWQRRYVEEPQRFEAEVATLKRFIADEEAGVEPAYGIDGAADMMLIAKELGFA